MRSRARKQFLRSLVSAPPAPGMSASSWRKIALPCLHVHVWECDLSRTLCRSMSVLALCSQSRELAGANPRTDLVVPGLAPYPAALTARDGLAADILKLIASPVRPNPDYKLSPHPSSGRNKVSLADPSSRPVAKY